MSRKNEIRLVVIIPVYGNWDDTLATLDALAKQDCKQFHVLIADDGSPSPPPPGIHNYEFAVYHRQPHGGFAVNCNRAARAALDRGATHLLFLNNDTDFSRDFAGGWLRTIANLPNAIISPVIFWFKNPASVWFSGGRMTVLTPFVRLSRRFQQTQAVDVVCGCTLLVPVGAWTQLNGFDETFALYFEDFDLALRANQAGIPVMVAADADLRVWHKVSGSFRGEGAWKQQYLLLTSRLWFIRRHYQGPRKLLCYGLACAHLAAMALVCIPEVPNPKLLWRATVRGLADSAD